MSRRFLIHLPEFFLLGAIFFGPLAFGAVEPWSLAILSVMICGALFSAALGKKTPDLRDPVYKTILPAVAGILVLGLFQRLNAQSILGPSSLMPSTVSAYATDRALLLWATYGAVLWCTPIIFDSSVSVRRLMFAIFGLGWLIAVIGLIQMSQHRLSIYGVRDVAAGEPFGPYYNRDHAASMLIMALFSGLGLFWDRMILYREAKEPLNISNFVAVQILLLFGVGLLFVGVFHTLSRAGLGALLIVSGAWTLYAIWSLRPRLRFILAGSVATLIVAAITMSPVANRLTIAHLSSSVDFRLSIYRGGIEVVRDFPWLGAGIGALQQAYPPYQSREVPGILEHVHSDWLEMVIQTGLVGFGLLTIGLIAYFRKCARLFFDQSRRFSFGLACGASAAIAAFMLHGLAEFSFQIPANAIIFFIVLASLGPLGKRAYQGAARDRSLAAKANVAVAFCAVVLAVLSVRPAFASRYYLAQSPADSADERAKKISKSIAYDANPRYFYELAKEQAAGALGSGRKIEDLRLALSNVETAVNLDPATPRYRYLNGSILWQLGRIRDGQDLIEGGKR